MSCCFGPINSTSIPKRLYYPQDHPFTSQGHDGNKVQEMDAKGSPWSCLSPQPGNFPLVYTTKLFTILVFTHHLALKYLLSPILMSLLLDLSFFAYESPHCPLYLHHTFLLPDIGLYFFITPEMFFPSPSVAERMMSSPTKMSVFNSQNL